jgi:hypothetical protein
MDHSSEREKNQKEFRAILDKYGLTQAHAAALITEQTYRPIQDRTVRTWLANADAVSARNCPRWAVIALKRATSTPPGKTKKSNFFTLDIGTLFL